MKIKLIIASAVAALFVIAPAANAQVLYDLSAGQDDAVVTALVVEQVATPTVEDTRPPVPDPPVVPRTQPVPDTTTVTRPPVPDTPDVAPPGTVIASRPPVPPNPYDNLPPGAVVHRPTFCNPYRTLCT